MDADEVTKARAPIGDRGEGRDIAIGDVIAERFIIEGLLGTGGMGSVFAALDRLREAAGDPKARVALKVLHRQFSEGTDGFIALQREVRRSQDMAHPNIVTFHDFALDRGRGIAFATMELLEGQPLDALLGQQPGGFTRDRARRILIDLAAGLSYAHERGWTHADFKPGNIFITTKGTAKILDFGIARAVPGKAEPDHFDTGVFGGITEPYASPEMIEGMKPVPGDDVFSLGIVGYQLFTGRHPFNFGSALEARELKRRPRAPRTAGRRNCRVIVKALAFERRARFQDAAEFQKALKRIPPLQLALVAVAVVLGATAGLSWYQNYLDGRPALAFERLPAEVQQDVRAALRQGDASLAYLEQNHDMSASADAAQYFADAYVLHPRNPAAVAGLKRAADYAIKWYRGMADRSMARAELQKFAEKSEFYSKYAPLTDALDSP